MRVAITGRLFVCYKKNGIEVTVENLLATNTEEMPETLGGTYIQILAFKDGQYTKQIIYPVKDSTIHFPNPLPLAPKGSTKIPDRKVYFEMNKESYDKIRKPFGGIVSLTLIDGDFKGWWMSETTRALEKLWTENIYDDINPKGNH